MPAMIRVPSEFISKGFYRVSHQETFAMRLLRNSNSSFQGLVNSKDNVTLLKEQMLR